MDESGMRVDQLEATGAKVAYVMPSHQFPMGNVMPIGRRLELLKWADSGEDRYLIEDDYDSEFRFHGKPIPALQSSDERGRVIYIGSFSKAIAPAIRVSFMVLPSGLLERYNRECSFYSCTVSRIDQSILNQFIKDGYFERHLNKMRKIYRAKHDLLLELLKPFGESFDISGENAGLHLLLTAKGNVSEERLLRTAEEKGVRVCGLSSYVVDSRKREGKAAVLLGFGGMSTAQLTEGVRLLKEAWM
jgi:GntR family transcriptional regulator/MocR family aminotransferase